jgi:hypothetical protein
MKSGLGGTGRFVAVATALALPLGVAIATATPASASTTTSLTPTSVSYVDSAEPNTNLLPTSTGDLPVGAFAGADGTIHQTKAYLNFSIKALSGHKVTAADLLIGEYTVADCTTPRDTQLWLTASAAKPTWNTQPAEQTDVGTAEAQSACPSTQTPLDWNIATAIDAAQQAGRTTVTLELRAPDNEQADVRYARYYSQVPTLTVTDESAPAAPNTLQVNGQNCTSAPLSVSHYEVYLGWTPQSATEPRQDITVDYWPVGNPAQITERSFPGAYTGDPMQDFIQPDSLTDGTTYAWHARGTVDGLVGPWSKTCELTADYTAPPNAPLVSSSDYPSPGAADGNGGSGIPGTFVFRPNGDTDVTQYWYGYDGNPYEFHVAASHKGGPATITFAPNGVGPTTLSVIGEDAADNGSPMANYNFTIKDNRPVVSCDPTGYAGVARTCVFSPGATTPSAVVGYSYSFGNGFTDVPVAANASATVQVTPTQVGDQTLTVFANLANGNSVETQVTVNALENAPTATGPTTPVGINQPVTLTMHAVLPGSATFTYGFYGVPPVTVPVGQDGTTTVTVAAPGTPGNATFLVHTTAADGTVSDPGGAVVTVVSDVPVVASTDYPEEAQSGQIGKPGTFTLSSLAPNVTGYQYVFDGHPAVTVPAGADGTAQISLTPEVFENHLVVSAIYADGHTSASYDYYFMAISYAPTGFCNDSPPAGSQFTCVLFASQPGAVSLTYAFDGSAPTTVPLDQNGEAVLTLTEPDHPAVLTVSTTDGNGTPSDPGTINIAGAGSAS